MYIMLFFFFFFFQAEDGIRDWSVTGVQTCALPIFKNRYVVVLNDKRERFECQDAQAPCRLFSIAMAERSEERRVGKECRSRWGRDDEKKKGEKRKNRIRKQKRR